MLAVAAVFEAILGQGMYTRSFGILNVIRVFVSLAKTV